MKNSKTSKFHHSQNYQLSKMRKFPNWQHYTIFKKSNALSLQNYQMLEITLCSIYKACNFPSFTFPKKTQNCNIFKILKFQKLQTSPTLQFSNVTITHACLFSIFQNLQNCKLRMFKITTVPTTRIFELYKITTISKFQCFKNYKMSIFQI